MRSSLVLIFFLIVGVLLGLGTWWFFYRPGPPTPEYEMVQPPVNEPRFHTAERATIGTSVEGRAIEAYTYGTGEHHLLFIGGIHGGYEWNSSALAYNLIDALEDPGLVPSSLTITIIPNANPDGLFKVTGKEGRFALSDVSTSTTVLENARFNAHQVDLNRNFACRWQPKGMWRSREVSAGESAFSEPETQAIRDWVLREKPSAVISWHSQANTVYPGECGNGIMAETTTLMNLYAQAANYQTAETFSAYTVTGDLEGWLSTIQIPSITVELKTHATSEWEQNFAGIMAIFNHYRS